MFRRFLLNLDNVGLNWMTSRAHGMQFLIPGLIEKWMNSLASFNGHTGWICAVHDRLKSGWIYWRDFTDFTGTQDDFTGTRSDFAGTRGEFADPGGEFTPSQGSYLLTQGKPAEDVMFIHSGSAKVLRTMQLSERCIKLMRKCGVSECVGLQTQTLTLTLNLNLHLIITLNLTLTVLM
jgi:hypothetical protein